jgi:hypothetical protein
MLQMLPGLLHKYDKYKWHNQKWGCDLWLAVKSLTMDAAAALSINNVVGFAENRRIAHISLGMIPGLVNANRTNILQLQIK